MIGRREFVERFGGVFEHSPWIAERAVMAGAIREPLTAESVHAALAAAFREAPAEQRLGVLRAHPDLAGKLAVADELTAESKSEQASAELDRLTEQEHSRFSELNSAYMERFDFPFIIAVKGLSKADILNAFEHRLANSREEEFATACTQVERIALLRLKQMLPPDDAGSRLMVEPLSAETFRPFGTVLDIDSAERRLINGGTTERFHALAEPDTAAEEGHTILSLFRGQPRPFPYAIAMMERHPLGSQAFFPLDRRPWLVAVAPDEAGRPGRPRVFRAEAGQGVQYARNVWHHPLIAVGETSDFLVADREGPGDNLEKADYPETFIVDPPGIC